MGKCKATDAFLAPFSQWAMRVPGSIHKAKCRFCACELVISNGSAALRQHETKDIHKKNVAAHDGGQTRVEQSMSRALSIADGTRRATILHILNLILNKHSLRSSESFTR